MKEKTISQKIKLFVLVIFTLLTLCLLSRVAPKTMAQENVPFDNKQYTFNTVNDGKISTVANPGETTILIFGYVGCGKTRSTLDSLSECNWIKRDDIRVIYVDAEGHSQQEVLSWAEAYNCPEMTFCYCDDVQTMMEIMHSYTNEYGGSYPVVVLIDGENKVQNVSQGKKTADAILEDIKKFKDMEGSDTDTPPSDSDSDLGFANYPYVLNSIDGTKVSTKANNGEATVLLFGYTTCGKTKSTLQEIDQNDWFDNRTDVRVIFADEHGHSLNEVKELAQSYNSGNIIFCHDESCSNYYGITVKYLHMFNENGGTYPYIVFIDKNNRVRDLTLGPQTAENIIEKIKSFSTIDDNKPSENPSDKPNDKPSENPSDKPNDKPSENPSDKPDDKPSENPSDKPNDKPSENPSDKPDDKPSENPSDKPNDKPSENPSDKPDDKPSDNGTTNTPNNNQGSNNGNTSNNNGSSSSNTGNTSNGNSTWTPNYSSGSNNSGSSSTSTSTNGSSSSTSSNITSPVPSVNNEKDTVEDTTKKEESIEDSKPLDNTNKETNVVVSDTVPTTPSNDTTQADKQSNAGKKTKTNTKKKAKVNAVKAAKGKKAVSGTIKLNSGKVVKNATIKIYVNNKKKTTAKSNGKGEFSIKLSKKLKKGDKIKLVITSFNTKKITKIIEIK